MPRVNQRIDVYAETGRAAELKVVARVWPIGEGECYTVSCNGDRVGHECPTDEILVIESGDTWQSIGGAVQFAVAHIAAHEGRGA